MKSKSAALYLFPLLLCGSVTSVKTGTPDLVLGVSLLASIVLLHDAAQQPVKNIQVHRAYGVLCKQQHEEVIQLLQQNKSFLEQLQRNETGQSDEILLGDVIKKLDGVHKKLDDAGKALNKVNQALKITNEKLARANDFVTCVDIMMLCSAAVFAGAAIYCRE